MKQRIVTRSFGVALVALLTLVLPVSAAERGEIDTGTGLPQVSDGMTREELVSLYQSLAAGQPAPPACVPGEEMFDDVPASHTFCPVIEELARRGVTEGCDADNFCPGNPVSRAQMAAFLVRALDRGPMESETNDSIETANVYPASGPAQGGILGVTGDSLAGADYWRVEHPGGDFAAETRSYNDCAGTTDGGDTILTLFDASGQEIAEDDDGSDAGEGFCSLIEETALPADTYFVRVTTFENLDVYWYALTIRVDGQPLMAGAVLPPAGTQSGKRTKSSGPSD